jgi:hypothetical protein
MYHDTYFKVIFMPYYEVKSFMNYAHDDNGNIIPGASEVRASFYASDDKAAVRAFSVHGFWEYRIYNEAKELIYDHSPLQLSGGKLKDYNPWIEFIRIKSQLEELGQPTNENYVDKYQEEIGVTLKSMSAIPIEHRKTYDFNLMCFEKHNNIKTEEWKFVEDMNRQFNDAKTMFFVQHCQKYAEIFDKWGYTGWSS